jgi:hypothetical protein
MAIYIFQNEETGEVKEVTQKMNELHVYSENGKEWKRIFTNPQMAVSTRLNPFSERQFLEKTKTVKTLGEAWDISKEVSEKRAGKSGKDPLKNKFFEQYSKTRGGRKHREQVLTENKVSESEIKSYKGV